MIFCRENKVHEHLPEEELPLNWHQAAPCMGKSVATLHLTATSDSALKLMWSGTQRSSIISRAFANGVRRARHIDASERCDACEHACLPFRTRAADVCTCGACDTRVIPRS